MAEHDAGDQRSLREQELEETASPDGDTTATSSGKKSKKKSRVAKSAAPSVTSASSSIADPTEVDSAITRRKARRLAEFEKAREILQADEEASNKRRKLREQELSGSSGEREGAATGRTGRTATRRLPISSTDMSGKAPEGRWESPSRDLNPDHLRLAQEGRYDDQSTPGVGETSYADILSRTSEGEARFSELGTDDRS